MKETPKRYRITTSGVEISKIDFPSIKIKNIVKNESEKEENPSSETPNSINPIKEYPHIIIVCISPKKIMSNNELCNTS